MCFFELKIAQRRDEKCQKNRIKYTKTLIFIFEVTTNKGCNESNINAGINGC